MLQLISAMSHFGANVVAWHQTFVLALYVTVTDGASADRHALGDVEIHDQGNVIEMIITGQFLVACRIGQGDRAVIVSITWGVAPAVIFLDGSQVDAAGSNIDAVLADHGAEQPKATPRRGPITLTRLDANARSAKRAFKHPGTGSQQSFCWMPGARINKQNS